MLLMQAGDPLTDVVRVVSVLWLQDELGSCLSACFVQLVSCLVLQSSYSLMQRNQFLQCTVLGI